MNPINIVQSLLLQNLQTDEKPVSFRPGQIISGEVLKLFPNQFAEVKLGGQRVIAQLETPISANNRYWFQVQPGEGKIHLKVLQGADKIEPKASEESLLKQFSLPVSKKNIQLLKFFINEQLPITKETLAKASQWLTDHPLIKDGLQAIKVILSKGLPFTQTVYDGVSSLYKDESLPVLMERLQALLSGKENGPAAAKVTSMLNDIHSAEKPASQQPAQYMADQLKNLVKIIGYSYENEVIHALLGRDEILNPEKTLKEQVIRLLHENPPEAVKEAAEKVLNKITGQQVISKEDGPIQQFVCQLPFTLFDRKTNVTMQWSGRSKADGSIDSDYCRVLFYLSLDFLKEVIVDFRVQNRMVTIHIANDLEGGALPLSRLAAPFMDELKSGLEKINFTLLSVKFTKPFEKSSQKSMPSIIPNQYNKVDVRV